MEYGYVGADYYRPLLDQLSRLRDRVTREGAKRPVAIAVLHHHLLPTGWVEDPEENRPISLTLDAGKLVEDLQAAQVDLALHGHQHLPFVGGTSRVFQAAATWQVPDAPLWVIGCGSSGVAVTRLWNEMRNNVLGVYHVEEAKFRVRMLQYAPNVDLSDYMDITLPLVSSQIDPIG
jgi:3',5'-cyclic AMP phosphodiesterase CpdA